MKVTLKLLFLLVSSALAQNIDEGCGDDGEKKANDLECRPEAPVYEGPCPDLIVQSYSWSEKCELSISIQNIGFATAPAKQGVQLYSVTSGSTLEWNMFDLIPGSIGWVDFGVVTVSGSTLTAVVDPYNQISECKEDNNKIKICVPPHCIKRKPPVPECWDVYVTHPSQGLHRVDTSAMTATFLSDMRSPYEIGFDNSQLWGYYNGAGLNDPLFRYSRTTGNIISSPVTATPIPGFTGLGLGTDATTGDLVGDSNGGAGITIARIDVPLSPLVSLANISPYSVAGDMASFDGDLYISAYSKASGPTLIRVPANTFTEEVVGSLPGSIWGLAEVGVIGGTQLWAFAGNGNVYKVNTSGDTTDLLGNIGVSVYGAASAPCLRKEEEAEVSSVRKGSP